MHTKEKNKLLQTIDNVLKENDKLKETNKLNLDITKQIIDKISKSEEEVNCFSLLSCFNFILKRE